MILLSYHMVQEKIYGFNSKLSAGLHNVYYILKQIYWNASASGNVIYSKNFVMYEKVQTILIYSLLYEQRELNKFNLYQ